VPAVSIVRQAAGSMPVIISPLTILSSSVRALDSGVDEWPV